MHQLTPANLTAVLWLRTLASLKNNADALKVDYSGGPTTNALSTVLLLPMRLLLSLHNNANVSRVKTTSGITDHAE